MHSGDATPPPCNFPAERLPEGLAPPGVVSPVSRCDKCSEVEATSTLLSRAYTIYDG